MAGELLHRSLSSRRTVCVKGDAAGLVAACAPLFLRTALFPLLPRSLCNVWRLGVFWPPLLSLLPVGVCLWRFPCTLPLLFPAPAALVEGSVASCLAAFAGKPLAASPLFASVFGLRERRRSEKPRKLLLKHPRELWALHQRGAQGLAEGRAILPGNALDRRQGVQVLARRDGEPAVAQVSDEAVDGCLHGM